MNVWCSDRLVERTHRPVIWSRKVKASSTPFSRILALVATRVRCRSRYCQRYRRGEVWLRVRCMARRASAHCVRRPIGRAPFSQRKGISEDAG